MNSGACGVKHEHIPSVDSIGTPLYVMIHAYRPSGTVDTSLACAALGAATFLRAPLTQILFSFAASAASIS